MRFHGCGARRGLVVLAALLLGACRGEVSGSPVPPAEFGSTSRPLFGCPDVVGVYVWPPVAGAHSGRMATNVEPWAGGIPVAVGRGEMQIWVSDDGGLLTVRSRRVNHAPNVRDRLAREWSYAEYAPGDYTCSGGMFAAKPVDVETGEDYGGEGIRRGFRLARLEDGALAVGVVTVSYGRKGAWFAWGGQSYGSYDEPDKTFYSWSKLTRSGPGDVEPAPIDAGASGRR